MTAFHGVYARVTDGEHEGYLHYDKLKSTNSTKAALAELQKHMERIEAQRSSRHTACGIARCAFRVETACAHSPRNMYSRPK